jgi:hypothetical protein
MLKAEIWKPVLGYEGYYEVSSLGRVRSMPRMRITKGGGRAPCGGIILKQRKNSLGYMDILLRKDLERTQRSKHYTVHTLVAEAFLGFRPAGMQVDHVDHDRTNNNVDNLRWLTQKENSRRRPATKLNEEIVNLIKKNVTAGQTQTSQAIAYGVACSTISKIVAGRRWAC